MDGTENGARKDAQVHRPHACCEHGLEDGVANVQRTDPQCVVDRKCLLLPEHELQARAYLHLETYAMCLRAMWSIPCLRVHELSLF